MDAGYVIPDLIRDRHDENNPFLRLHEFIGVGFASANAILGTKVHNRVRLAAYRPAVCAHQSGPTLQHGALATRRRSGWMAVTRAEAILKR